MKDQNKNNTMEREKGFYYVKVNGKWTCAYYYGAAYYKPWEIIGTHTGYEDYAFEEIGCKIEMPNP